MATHSSLLLENPMDRGAWWATVHRVAKSWTGLKRLCMHTCTHRKIKKSIIENKDICYFPGAMCLVLYAKHFSYTI